MVVKEVNFFISFFFILSKVNSSKNNTVLNLSTCSKDHSQCRSARDNINVDAEKKLLVIKLSRIKGIHSLKNVHFREEWQLEIICDQHCAKSAEKKAFIIKTTLIKLSSTAVNGKAKLTTKPSTLQSTLFSPTPSTKSYDFNKIFKHEVNSPLFYETA